MTASTSVSPISTCPPGISQLRLWVLTSRISAAGFVTSALAATIWRGGVNAGEFNDYLTPRVQPPAEFGHQPVIEIVGIRGHPRNRAVDLHRVETIQRALAEDVDRIV